MKTLILPDIHDRLDRVQAILLREKPDQVVSLGDWFDSWTGDIEEAKATARFLKEQTKDWTLIVGNHDVSYGWGPACSGWTLSKHKAINGILTKEDWQRFKPWAKVGPYICTHAGVHKYFWEGWEHFVESMHDLTFELKDVGKYQRSSLLGAGFDRGGDQRYGGIIWCDWSRLVPPKEVKQLCGHTPAREVRYRNDKDVICIDTALNDYAIWDGEKLNVKHF